MHRFFCPNIDLRQNIIVLTESKEVHHLKNVLRLRPGDSVALFNGSGEETAGEILSIDPFQVQIQPRDGIRTQSGARWSLTLACAIPKKSKFETIIEKCTELGADEIVPIYTQRTEVIYKKGDIDKKMARYRTVSINAAKQSQRTTLPILQAPIKFTDYLARRDPKALLIIPCLISPRKKLNTVLNELPDPPGKLIFLIGPEGDFTPEEVQLAVQKGGIPVSLGPTVLKVETAAIAVLAHANLTLRE